MLKTVAVSLICLVALTLPYAIYVFEEYADKKEYEKELAEGSPHGWSTTRPMHTFVENAKCLVQDRLHL